MLSKVEGENLANVVNDVIVPAKKSVSFIKGSGSHHALKNKCYYWLLYFYEFNITASTFIIRHLTSKSG